MVKAREVSFTEQTDPILLIDFAGQRIFESATVEVNILMFARIKTDNKQKLCIIKEKLLKKMSDFVRQKATKLVFTNNSNT